MNNLDNTFRVEVISLLSSNKRDKANVLNLLQSSKIMCVNEYSTHNVILLFDENIEKEELLTILIQQKKNQKRLIGIDFSEKPTPLTLLCELRENGMEEVISWQWKSKIGKIILKRLVRWKIIDTNLYSPKIQDYIIGGSASLVKVLKQALEVACFSKLPVLIMGESGTGKESIAKLIHNFDRRADKQGFIVLDCTTISPELSGSEFFGHEKGAFTNAIENRDGAFALADRGTLFIDEIGELPMNLQAELLRVVQEKSYKRVGSNIWRKTNFRLVSATNRNLSEEIEFGRFRLDLFHRLNTCLIKLPPLRDRKLDIPDLASYFLKEALDAEVAPIFSKPVLHFLMAKDYIGNIRELKQIVNRMAYRYTGEGPITMGCIPEMDLKMVDYSENAWLNQHFENSLRLAIANGIGLKEIKRLTANLAMDLAIESTDQNLSTAAKVLDVTARTLQVYQAGKKQEN